ncbi:MAG: carbon-nitrogen hydrolase family protein [Planctomycetota bacterium]
MLVTQSTKVAACQLPVVDRDIDTALSWIDDYAQRAAAMEVRLVCFPECFLQGYLVQENHARTHAMDLSSAEFQAVLQRLAHLEPVLVFGMIECSAGSLFNTAVVIHRGALMGRYRKTHLLSGERIFSPGGLFPVFTVDALTFGINICSDTQVAAPAEAVAAQGAQLILCPANNMMKRASAEKWKNQHNPVRAARAKESGCWFVSADVTGQCEHSIGLGPTAVMNPLGHVVAQVPLMETGVVTADVPTKPNNR